MRVTNESGTDLRVISLSSIRSINMVLLMNPVTLTTGAQVICTLSPMKGRPRHGVIQPGDICVLPYNRFFETEVFMDIRDGFIRRIEGPGLDARLMRNWLAGNKRDDKDMDGYAISHLGWGTNPYCRWDNMALNGDHNDRNNGNARGFAGNFLFSTGRIHKGEVRALPQATMTCL